MMQGREGNSTACHRASSHGGSGSLILWGTSGKWHKHTPRMIPAERQRAGVFIQLLPIVIGGRLLPEGIKTPTLWSPAYGQRGLLEKNSP